jgi:hypothetical protein
MDKEFLATKFRRMGAISLYKLGLFGSNEPTKRIVGLGSRTTESTTNDTSSFDGSSATPLPKNTQSSNKFEPGFIDKLKEICDDLGIDYRHLLIVMAFETGGTFSPSKRPPINKRTGKRISTATGLIQFLSSTAENLGTSTEALAKMSQVKQLDYVHKYLKPYKGRMRRGDFGDVYLAVFSPAFIGKPDSFVCYRRGQDGYTRNAPLDTNKNGLMTRGEIWHKAYSSGIKHLGWE